MEWVVVAVCVCGGLRIARRDVRGCLQASLRLHDRRGVDVRSERRQRRKCKIGGESGAGTAEHRATRRAGGLADLEAHAARDEEHHDRYGDEEHGEEEESAIYGDE